MQVNLHKISLEKSIPQSLYQASNSKILYHSVYINTKAGL